MVLFFHFFIFFAAKIPESVNDWEQKIGFSLFLLRSIAEGRLYKLSLLQKSNIENHKRYFMTRAFKCTRKLKI